MTKLNISVVLIILALSVVSSAEAKTKPSRQSVAAPEVICMQAAIGKRDLAIAGSYDVFASSSKASIINRSTNLKAAWVNTGDQRSQALRDAWQTFRKTKTQIASQSRQTITNAWKTFYADRRNCGPTAAQADITTEQIDRVE